jgi:hypothetical protein
MNIFDCNPDSPGLEIWVERVTGIPEITPQTPAVAWACGGLHATGPVAYVVDHGGMAMVCQPGDRGFVTEEMRERFHLLETKAYEEARRIFAEMQKRAAGAAGLN